VFGIKDTLCGPLLRSGAVLPMEIQTTLLPFRGRIVYDGVSIAASNGTCCISQISRLPVLPLTLVTVPTDYPDCCPYIVQYTRYTRLTLCFTYRKVLGREPARHPWTRVWRGCYGNGCASHKTRTQVRIGPFLNPGTLFSHTRLTLFVHNHSCDEPFPPRTAAFGLRPEL
jgi:hypothetical protein